MTDDTQYTNNMKQLFLIAGKRRSGKDHITEILINTFTPMKFRRFSFGNELKSYIYPMLNLTYNEGEDLKNLDNGTIDVSLEHFLKFYDLMIKDINNSLYKTTYNYQPSKYNHINQILLDIGAKFVGEEVRNINVRLALQFIASHVKVLFNDNQVWSKMVYSKINASTDKNFIISDFRFPFEAEDATINNNIIVTTIQVIGKNRYEFNSLIDTHESERALDDYKFDYLINNSAYSSDSIIAQFRAILKEINYEQS